MRDETINNGNIQFKNPATKLRRDISPSFLKTDVVFVDQDMPVIEVAKLMRDKQVGDVIVTKFSNERLKPVGIITDRDLAVGIIAEKKSAETMRAVDLMTQPVTVAYETDGIYDMIRTMKKEGIGRLPIVDENGALMGIITAKKLLQLLAQEFSDLINFNRKSPRKDLTVNEPQH